MVKAIIFDFDGVILESPDIKTDAFKELFQGYPEKLEAIINYHLLNGGVSRYVKFRYIYEHILKQELLEQERLKLEENFSQIVFKKVLAAPFVSGIKEFLDRNKEKYQFFIVSGTPEEELEKIVFARKLENYFKEIHGSPKEKKDTINNIVQRYNFDRDSVAYVGDAESDRRAASHAGILFIERKANFDAETKENSWIIKDLNNLDEILKRIENN